MSQPFRLGVLLAGVALLHLLLALVATYPAILSFNTALIGGGDSAQNAWNLWWVRLAAGRGEIFPFYTSMLYHPKGVSLAFHTLGLFNDWIGVVLQSVLGVNLQTTFNLIVITTFVATGLATFYLVLSLTNSPVAALCASLIFTYAPIRMSRVLFGNLNLYSTQFIPITVLFFIKAFQTQKWRYVILAALGLALTALSSLELAFGTGILLFLVYISYRLAVKLPQLRRQLGPDVRILLAFTGLTVLFTLPLLLAMLSSYGDFAGQSNQVQASTLNSADLLGFFIPDHITSPVASRGIKAIADTSQSIYQTFYGNPYEKTVFIGYAVIILLILSAVVSRTPDTWRWIFISGVFFILSLGPVLYVAGNPIFQHMPYSIFSRLPLVSLGRSPGRLAIFLMLALAVVVGYGVAGLESRSRNYRYLILLVCALIYGEYLIIPMKLDYRLSDVPDYYHQLASDPDPGAAVLDVPIDLYGAQGLAINYMVYQIVHQKPIVGGYISRTPEKALWLFKRPFLRALRARIYGNETPYGFDKKTLAGAMKDLELLGVRYVILHADELQPGDFATLRAVLVSVLAEPDYEDGRLTVWKIP